MWAQLFSCHQSLSGLGQDCWKSANSASGPIDQCADLVVAHCFTRCHYLQQSPRHVWRTAALSNKPLESDTQFLKGRKHTYNNVDLHFNLWEKGLKKKVHNNWTSLENIIHLHNFLITEMKSLVNSEGPQMITAQNTTSDQILPCRAKITRTVVSTVGLHR